MIHLFALALATLLATGGDVTDEAVIKAQSPSYPLTTCIASDEALEEGKTFDLVHEGRLVRFCCKGCVKHFKEDSTAMLAKLDSAVVRAQLHDYPVKTCAISGEALDEKAINYVHGTRLVRFCCKGCIGKFEAKAETVMQTIDLAYVKAQLASYPLKTCVVSGEAIDDGAKNMLHGTQLVRLCCSMCKRDFAKDPSAYLEKVAMAMPRTEHDGGRKHDEHGGHDGGDRDGHGDGDHGDRGDHDGHGEGSDHGGH